LFRHHRTAGPASAMSNISDHGSNGGFRETAMTDMVECAVERRCVDRGEDGCCGSISGRIARFSLFRVYFSLWCWERCSFVLSEY
jgi:hypothetical protein